MNLLSTTISANATPFKFGLSCFLASNLIHRTMPSLKGIFKEVDEDTCFTNYAYYSPRIIFAAEVALTAINTASFFTPIVGQKRVFFWMASSLIGLSGAFSSTIVKKLKLPCNEYKWQLLQLLVIRIAQIVLPGLIVASKFQGIPGAVVATALTTAAFYLNKRDISFSFTCVFLNRLPFNNRFFHYI